MVWVFLRDTYGGSSGPVTAQKYALLISMKDICVLCSLSGSRTCSHMPVMLVAAKEMMVRKVSNGGVGANMGL